MPGAPFLTESPPYAGVPGEGVRPAPTSGGRGPAHHSFIVWVVVLGVLLPAAILGGLQLGGFQFVFRSR